MINGIEKVEKLLVRGVTKDNDVARISIVDIPDEPGNAFRIFDTLAQHNINIDMILQSTGRDGKKDISFTVAEGHCDEAVEAVKACPGIKAEMISTRADISKVSIVGAGMVSHAGVASTMFEALYNSGINIHMICTSEIKVSVLIDRDKANLAVSAIHDQFSLGA